MMSSKKVLTKGYGQRAATACALMVLVVLLVVPSTGMGASKPTTVAELALYQGPDREQILIEGAKKEGSVTFYIANTTLKQVILERFPKKYPFIKPELWRSSAPPALKRIMEEYRGKHYIVDAVGSSSAIVNILAREGILQEYDSPELRSYPDAVMKKGEKGIYFCSHREIYLGMGFNTTLVSPAEAPKTYEDLLDPKWKGKMSICGTETGVHWIGVAVQAKGRDFIEKLTQQDVKVQNVSGKALFNMCVSGEVPLSPSMYNSAFTVAKKQGVPVEWYPLEPVYAHTSFVGLATKAPHPHAAMLLLDYTLSKEGQEALVEVGGLSSARTDVVSTDMKCEKMYLENLFSLEDYEKNYAEWEKLLRQFIK